MVIETEADVLRVIRQNPRIVFRALQEDPELLVEVRRLILTDELLAMPAQLAEVIETQNKMLETQNWLIERQDRIEVQIGHLRGAELEQRIIRILPTRLNSMYNLYRTRVMQGYGVLTTVYTEPFQDKVEDAHMSSIISDRQLRRIQETDMIVQARRRGGQSSIYIAVEASATVRESDVVRAKDAADALQAVFEMESAAVATGYRIRPEDRRRAEDAGVAIIILDEPAPLT